MLPCIVPFVMAHTVAITALFLLYNNTNSFIAPYNLNMFFFFSFFFFIPHVGARGATYPCYERRVYCQCHACWNNKPPSLALSLIWWMEKGEGGGEMKKWVDDEKESKT